MAAMQTLVAETPPMQQDTDGVFRIGGTRVRLETVVTAFQNGATPEEILQKYPALNLPDIYAVIAYYLRHSEDIASYLEERRKAREEAELEIETRFPSAGIRERLMARRAAQT